MNALTDEEIEKKLEDLLGEERAGLAEFLRHLDWFDQRRIANKRAFPSTFEYCTRKLGLSEDEAYRRIHVARKARTHARLLDMIREGSLSLSAASRIAPSLTQENREELLAKASGKTVREVEVIVAAGSEPGKARSLIAIVAPLPAAESASGVPALAAEGAPPTTLEHGVRFHFTVPRAVHEKFLRARDLTRHKRPSGLPEEIFEDALDALLDEVDRSRKDKPSAPRGEGTTDSRRIPEWVKDLVTRRDGGRCAFTAEDGRRCEARAWLEFDHVRPFAKGGRSDDPRNVRLLCRAHNQHERRAHGLAAPGDPAIDMEVRRE